MDKAYNEFNLGRKTPALKIMQEWVRGSAAPIERLREFYQFSADPYIQKRMYTKKGKKRDSERLLDAQEVQRLMHQEGLSKAKAIERVAGINGRIAALESYYKEYSRRTDPRMFQTGPAFEITEEEWKAFKAGKLHLLKR